MDLGLACAARSLGQGCPSLCQHTRSASAQHPQVLPLPMPQPQPLPLPQPPPLPRHLPPPLPYLMGDLLVEHIAESAPTNPDPDP